jgi:hypothetical protein
MVSSVPARSCTKRALCIQACFMAILPKSRTTRFIVSPMVLHTALWGTTALRVCCGPRSLASLGHTQHHLVSMCATSAQSISLAKSPEPSFLWCALLDSGARKVTLFPLLVPRALLATCLVSAIGHSAYRARLDSTAANQA